MKREQRVGADSAATDGTGQTTTCQVSSVLQIHTVINIIQDTVPYLLGKNYQAAKCHVSLDCGRVVTTVTMVSSDEGEVCLALI